MKKLLTTSILISAITASTITFTGCDKVNRASRTMDTAFGGDYKVEVIGTTKTYFVKNDKVTSEPEKGYYIFYAEVDGKKTLVQTPIGMTIITKVD